MKALDDRKINAIVVGGIGEGALTGLILMGIKVYRSQGTMIQKNMTMVKNRTLPALIPRQCCGEQDRDGGCAH
jgi:predicted Fe-Mo cluster-binding NifX family protein